jgi:hypothetical protein
MCGTKQCSQCNGTTFSTPSQGIAVTAMLTHKHLYHRSAAGPSYTIWWHKSSKALPAGHSTSSSNRLAQAAAARDSSSRQGS